MSDLSLDSNVHMTAEALEQLGAIPHSEIKPALEKVFLDCYGASDEAIVSVAAPARVNIIGEHIDYNGGMVLPAAIDRYLYVLARKRSDTTIMYTALQFQERFSFDTSDKFFYKKENSYANYLNGMLSILQGHGCELKAGFEVLVFSTIPVGSGLSSSAALEIAFGYTVARLFDFSVTGVELAKMGQEAEHRFMNVKCGIMDQFIIAMGKKNAAVLLNTETLDYEVVPINFENYLLVILNSNKARTLADSKYNERRGECEQALALLQKEHADLRCLCALSEEAFAEEQKILKDETIRKRARHCVSENARVHTAVSALKNGEEALLGRILLASHESLREDYEVTGFELDSLVSAANASPYCCGARMTGAGFGGCAVALVEKEHIDDFVRTTTERYYAETKLNAEIFPCHPSDGVSVL